MIVSLSSVAGSPGVSSWALLLAAAWPQTDTRDRVVLEAATDGGVFGARYGFGVDPGVSALAAVVRRERMLSAVDVSEFARPVADGLWLVPGPESGEQATVLWSSPGTAAAIAAAAAADDGRVWLIDAGRVHAGSVTFPLAAEAALAVVVCAGWPAELVQVPARVACLQRAAGSVGVMVVGKTDYGTVELAEFCGTGIVWHVPASTDVVHIAGAVLSSRRARHSLVWRSALDVAADIAARTTVPAGIGVLADGG